uniref:ATP-dependent Clp protease proteolytic subunit n=2 Tax=Physena TaxID=63762 RepID=A0A411JUX5_9CARY|nr:clp protease proteolytic subunit [Physena sessiliflora]YP_009569475.1 clp protease proteolytic subunit [Physena madagascariensis]QBC68869.1 clp protease proteolytic subunit [Physena madagascariensis]QBC68945.1 clp protease proteolytic subunit [Physena sessiliflora]
MPVGVPKVPFRIPGEEDASWVDLYNRVYRGRSLFLGSALEAEISNNIIGLMIYLGIEDPTQEMYLFINSPGGSVIYGVGIFDTIQLVKPQVTTIGMGIAASMAALILLGGEMTKRIAFPHVRVMIHQPASAYFNGKSEDCIFDSEELLKIRHNVVEIFARRTGKPYEVVSEDIERDVFMSATEAAAYGIVDFVGDDYLDHDEELPWWSRWDYVDDYLDEDSRK